MLLLSSVVALFPTMGPAGVGTALFGIVGLLMLEREGREPDAEFERHAPRGRCPPSQERPNCPATAIVVAMNFSGINAIDALVWNAVLNGAVAPPIMVLIMLLARDEKVMGRRRIGGPLTVLGWTATALMSAALVGLIYFTHDRVRLSRAFDPACARGTIASFGALFLRADCSGVVVDYPHTKENDALRLVTPR